MEADDFIAGVLDFLPCQTQNLDLEVTVAAANSKSLAERLPNKVNKEGFARSDSFLIIVGRGGSRKKVGPSLNSSQEQEGDFALTQLCSARCPERLLHRARYPDLLI